VAYISDHQAPADGGMDVAESVLELCDGVDLLIHDAQYTPDEFREKAHWGHCSVDYAVHVAEQAGARRLARERGLRPRRPRPEAPPRRR